MAAAEYFNPNASMASGAAPAPGPAAGPQHPPPPAGGLPRPNPPPQNLAPPYPISDAPPPYTEQQRPHSQPPPGQRPTVHFSPSDHQPYRPNQPNQSNVDTHQYPPEKMPQTQQRPAPQNMYRPGDFQSAQPPPFQVQPNAYPPNAYPTPVAPGLSQVYPNTQPQRPSSSGQSLYRRSSRSRSRSRERRKRHQHKAKTEPQRSKDSGMNTFLGAGGGAIIGDLIFPGLGTLGGAIIGGVGGHEYTKNKTHRSSSNPSRTYRRSYSNSADYYADDPRRGRY